MSFFYKKSLGAVAVNNAGLTLGAGAEQLIDIYGTTYGIFDPRLRKIHHHGNGTFMVSQRGR